MMRSESSNYKLGRLDKVLVLKFVLTPTDPDTEFKMVRGRTIKSGGQFEPPSPGVIGFILVYIVLSLNEDDFYQQQ